MGTAKVRDRIGTAAGHEPPLDYAGRQLLRTGYSGRAFVSFVSLMAAIVPITVAYLLDRYRMDPMPVVRYGWPVTMGGGAAALVTGFRTLVLFERKENHEMKGIWMAFLGFIGGGIIVLVGCVAGLGAVAAFWAK